MLTTTTEGLGFSLNPIKAVKSVARSTASAGRVVGRETVKVAKTTGKIAVAPAYLLAVAPSRWLASKLTVPIRSRVNKLKNRRAAKLAWDRRKNKTPNAAEQAEAKTWTQNKLKGTGPHGRILALFAGPSYVHLGSSGLGEPVSAGVIAASLPILIAVLNALLNKSAKSGEAPADPAGDQRAEMQAQAEAQVAAAQYPESVQDSAPPPGAQEVANEIATAANQVEQALPPPPGMVRVPGLRAPVKQSHLLIGGIVLAGVLTVALLTRK
jgi:hypothetical protein